MKIPLGNEKFVIYILQADVVDACRIIDFRNLINITTNNKMRYIKIGFELNFVKLKLIHL